MSFISKRSVMDIIQSDGYYSVPSLGKALYHAMLCSCTVGGIVKNPRSLAALVGINSDAVYASVITSLEVSMLIRSCEQGFYIENWPKICDPEFRED